MYTQLFPSGSERIPSGTGATSPRRAFTLVEMLVVVTIIGLLTMLILPGVQAARESARGVKCRNSLKQIGLALHSYHNLANVLPAGFLSSTDGITTGWGWGSQILGLLEQRPLMNSCNFSLAISQASNSTSVFCAVSTFECPSATSGPFSLGHLGFTLAGMDHIPPTQYIGSAGTFSSSQDPSINPFVTYGVGDGVFFRNSVIDFPSITDGLSSTLMVGERSRQVADATWIGVPLATAPLCTKSGWDNQSCDSCMFLSLGRTGSVSPDAYHIGGPTDYRINSRGGGADGFSSQHPGMANFLFCDGSVRPIKNPTQLAVLSALSSRSGHEIFSENAY